MKIFFTSDTHFGHRNIVELSRRPFANLTTMESEIIRRWNLRVSPNDEVIHLGDFAFGDKKFQTEMRAKLNGRITLVRGNHDRSTKSLLDIGFQKVVDEAQIADDFGRLWYLAHKPWWQLRSGIIGPRLQLCGHVHGDWVRLCSDEYDIINVGVDAWDFTPRTLEELIVAFPREIPLKEAMAIPHHGEM